MARLKTKKGVAKRFKLTKKRKLKYASCGKSHLATGKETKQIRKLRKGGIFSAGRELKFLKRMLPYG